MQRQRSTGRAPKELTSYQLEVVATEWFDEGGHAYTDTLEKARRIGGSTAAACRGALFALGRQLRTDGTFEQCDPMDGWVVSKDYAGAKGVIREIAESCEELAPQDPDFHVEAHQTTVYFPASGRTITALPCSATACRGKTGFLLGDEVGFWRNQEEVWAAAKIIANPTLSAPRGYPALLVTTPWEAGSLAHRIFTDPSFPFRRHTVDIYKAKAAGFPIDPERAFAELGVPELVETEYLCRWSHGGATFFRPEKLRDAQVDDNVVLGANGEAVREWSGLPERWADAPCRIGIDVGGGRGRDFTAAVQWRLIDGCWWMVGLKAFNNIPIDLQVDEVGDWILGIQDAVQVDIRIDEGIMGADLIRLLSKKLAKAQRTRRRHLLGVSMNLADQERYAIAGRRLLERGQMRIYTGKDAGGDENGARALMLELGQMKSKPGVGGRLTFVTPRDPTKGHLDRAWASLIGLDEADEIPVPILPPGKTLLGRAGSGRWSGVPGRGFG